MVTEGTIEGVRPIKQLLAIADVAAEKATQLQANRQDQDILVALAGLVLELAEHVDKIEEMLALEPLPEPETPDTSETPV